MSYDQQGNDYVQPPVAMEDRYGLVLNNMNLKNGQTGELLFDTNFQHDESRCAFWGHDINMLRVTVPATVLECLEVAREINFSTREAINHLRLEQIINFQGQLLEKWNFEFGFCIPGSTNTWQQTIQAAENAVMPAEVLSDNIEIHSYFYDGEELILHYPIRLLYQPMDCGIFQRAYEAQFQQQYQNSQQC